MEWFRNYITDNSEKIDDINSLRCQYPYYDVLMTEIPAEDFSCCKIKLISSQIYYQWSYNVNVCTKLFMTNLKWFESVQLKTLY